MFERRSRNARRTANGRYTWSLICDFTYLGITLSYQLSLPIFCCSLWNLLLLLTMYQNRLLANFTKIESRKMLYFYIHANGAFLKSLSVQVWYLGIVLFGWVCIPTSHEVFWSPLDHDPCCLKSFSADTFFAHAHFCLALLNDNTHTHTHTHTNTFTLSLNILLEC